MHICIQVCSYTVMISKMITLVLKNKAKLEALIGYLKWWRKFAKSGMAISLERKYFYDKNYIPMEHHQIRWGCSPMAPSFPPPMAILFMHLTKKCDIFSWRPSPMQFSGSHLYVHSYSISNYIII